MNDYALKKGWGRSSPQGGFPVGGKGAMGSPISKAGEKANCIGVERLRAACAQFMQAREGTSEQRLAFEGILRTLVSYQRNRKRPRARKHNRVAA
jgi:hypothetical protein